MIDRKAIAACACALGLLAQTGANAGAAAPTPASAAAPALTLVAKIPVPPMTGTWDHLTVDPVTQRLFMSAQDQQTVYVVDVPGRALVHRINADFDRPQGELYVPQVGRLVVTNGRDGRVRILHGHNYRVAATLTLSLGADMIAFDPRHRVLYVESGGTDSRRGPGWLALIDPVTGELVGKVTTGYRAAALVMAHERARLYVAIPAQDQVAVIDTDTRRIIKRFAVPGRPASMALDEAHRRLFVATRTFPGDPRPPTFNVLDSATGRRVASLPSEDATEDMAFDPAHRGIYTSSLAGFVQAYRQIDADHYRLTTTLRTVPHSGTSQFLPGINELCVAAPPYAGHPAAVWVFRAGS